MLESFLQWRVEEIPHLYTAPVPWNSQNFTFFKPTVLYHFAWNWSVDSEVTSWVCRVGGGEAGHGFGICDSKASLPEEIRIKKNSRGEVGATAGYRLGLMQDLTILICSDSDGFSPSLDVFKSDYIHTSFVTSLREKPLSVITQSAFLIVIYIWSSVWHCSACNFSSLICSKW